MFSYIKGNLADITEDMITIESNNIGFLIRVTSTILNKHPMIGQELKVYTYMYVREDEISLYGFATKEELDVFKLLIGVSGVGPKVGQSILSTLSVDDLVVAVLSEDVKAISKANGIAAKGAGRIIIELKDKIAGYGTSSKDDVLQAVASGVDDVVGETTMALVSLGYSNLEAVKAIRMVKDAKNMTSEDLLKASLKYII